MVHSHPQAQYDGEDTKGKVETKTDVPSWFLACGEDKRGDNACVLAECIEHSERDRSIADFENPYCLLYKASLVDALCDSCMHLPVQDIIKGTAAYPPTVMQKDGE